MKRDTHMGIHACTQAKALEQHGTLTKMNYLKERLIYYCARHTLNPDQTGLRLQYPPCRPNLARRQIQIGLPYLPCQQRAWVFLAYCFYFQQVH